MSAVGPFSFELVRVSRQREHDLVRGTVQRAFPILEIEEHADAGLHVGNEPSNSDVLHGKEAHIVRVVEEMI